ncbi:hypothetical protein HanRHA438_Chr10g0454421 [Helianthus annuus]|nr:hypothetical protein HanRHA438_Chr10g0454421 [Helianthus annuus]
MTALIIGIFLSLQQKNILSVIKILSEFNLTDEPVISHSLKISELGNILLSVESPTSKKINLFYMFKVNPLSE